ncbi:hypothetical protein TI39_contig4106g00021 [Zymoseptoria brevis]|uniref:RING-type domain-containing protein n=1 Tax=Zymoseptoria brevis TaxID=1047168 RepID=A0A0F4GH95_9PEZI|nr:hypothetical protein TI39_contig4106g00021 [Zymoseptoria brevis]
MASIGSTIGGIATSRTAHMLLDSLAAVYLPKLPFFFVAQFLGVYELVSYMSTDSAALPSIRAYLSSLPSPNRLFTAQEECTHCKDIFEDPVILSCGHVFCRECIHSWLAFGKDYCPLDSKVVISYRLRDEGRISTLLKIDVCVLVCGLTAMLVCVFVLPTQRPWLVNNLWRAIGCSGRHIWAWLRILLTSWELAVVYKSWHRHGSAWWRHYEDRAGQGALLLTVVRGLGLLVEIAKLQDKTFS